MELFWLNKGADPKPAHAAQPSPLLVLSLLQPVFKHTCSRQANFLTCLLSYKIAIYSKNYISLHGMRSTDGLSFLPPRPHHLRRFDHSSSLSSLVVPGVTQQKTRGICYPHQRWKGGM